MQRRKNSHNVGGKESINLDPGLVWTAWMLELPKMDIKTMDATVFPCSVIWKHEVIFYNEIQIRLLGMKRWCTQTNLPKSNVRQKTLQMLKEQTDLRQIYLKKKASNRKTMVSSKNSDTQNRWAGYSDGYSFLLAVSQTYHSRFVIKLKKLIQ